MYTFIGKSRPANQCQNQTFMPKKSFCTPSETCCFKNFFNQVKQLLPSWIIWSMKLNQKDHLLDKKVKRSFYCMLDCMLLFVLSKPFLTWPEKFFRMRSTRLGVFGSLILIDAAFFSWTVLSKYGWDIKKWIHNFIVFKLVFFIKKPKIYPTDMVESNKVRKWGQYNILMTKYHCI